jgi:hypothetical protein
MGTKQRNERGNRFHFSLRLGRSRKALPERGDTSVTGATAQSEVQFANPEPAKEITSISSRPVSVPPLNPQNASGDLRRTLLRYDVALGNFEKALQSREVRWKSTNISKYYELGGDPAKCLNEQIEEMLELPQLEVENKDFWKKGKATMEKLFTTLSPLAKNLLGIAKTASSVFSCFLARLI